MATTIKDFVLNTKYDCMEEELEILEKYCLLPVLGDKFSFILHPNPTCSRHQFFGHGHKKLNLRLVRRRQ